MKEFTWIPELDPVRLDLTVSSFIPQGMGWIPDLPDPRDFTIEHEPVRDQLAALKPASSQRRSLPKFVDLRADDEDPQANLSGVLDQQALNCSAVCAVLGLIEYFERRVHGLTFEGSMLFLYKMVLKLRHTTEDGGADLRTTLKALRRFGVPPAELWHNDPSRFDDEPLCATLVGYAREYQDIRYVRLVPRNQELKKSRRIQEELGASSLHAIKSFLAAGFPVALGFSVPKSLTADARIPYRPALDSIRGGQAMLAVGYDDRKNTSPKGAILVRSSWGHAWGDAGYGWLPYAYIERGLARDTWTLLRPDWIVPSELSLPSVVASDSRAIH